MSLTIGVGTAFGKTFTVRELRGGPVRADLNENRLFQHPLAARLVLLGHALMPERMAKYADAHATRLRGRLAWYVNYSAEIREVTRENVACFSGREQAVHTLLAKVHKKGGKIVTASVKSSMVSQVALVERVGVTSVKLSEGKEGTVFDGKTADAIIEAAKGEAVKAVWIDSTNNPLGVHAPREQIERILREVSTDKLVVVDEAYFEYHNQTVVDLLKGHPNLVIIRSMSNAFGLANMRIGYTVASAEVTGRILGAKPTYNVSGLAQEIAEVLLTPSGVKSMKRTCAELVKERERVRKELDRLGYKTLPPFGNFVTLRVPGKAEEMAGKIQAEHGVFLKECGPDLLRITVGTHEENDAVILALVDFALADFVRERVDAISRPG